MDYEIAFDDTEQTYRIATEYEFSAIADWVSEELKEREDIQKVLQSIHLVDADTETQITQQGVYIVSIGAEGVSVNRQVDMSDVGEEISAMFDTQSDFYQASDEGIKSECGLEDMVGLLEDWHNLLY
ncbi:MAG: YacL family protein [Marinomonas sp.]|jgi:uncharacterized protein YacL (UPF0231 family)|uniref:YacL family protein n=1 Tax=unclassified Marinomonas TaxID=196814 RepID=UPI0005FA0918|nr:MULTISPECIES: YacL family protein [unclassified Marinomonas]KJZ10697.1 hypothetical protein TW85_19600 [Marinomonas sp. S3726]KZM38948.1 hypothetical protein OA92_21490 [Marinomonas sp. SBI22]KZM39635.1 hypothetical protein OA91_21340 [Marinomonas sp. SBI8L]